MTFCCAVRHGSCPGFGVAPEPAGPLPTRGTHTCGGAAGRRLVRNPLTRATRGAPPASAAVQLMLT